MRRLEEVALAIETYVHNGKRISQMQISSDTHIDDTLDDLVRQFRYNAKLNEDDARYLAENYLFFAKWNLWKTVYHFEPVFLEALSQTSDFVFHLASLKTLPFHSFLISESADSPKCLLVYIEEKGSEAFFSVSDINDVNGDELLSNTDTLWIRDGQRLSDALAEWMKVINGDKDYKPYWDHAYQNVRTAIQVAYYLSAKNSVVKEVHVPKNKRAKRKNGKPLNLQYWDVGYRLACPFEPSSALVDIENVGTAADGSKNSPRPHVRRAHWHHYWTGAGRNTLELRWIEPIWVNGEEDDIVASGYEVL